MTNFEKNLIIGERFENDYAYPILVDRFRDYWIECTHEYKTGKFSGPKVTKYGEQELILPDFKLYNPKNGHKIMVEAKFRKKPFRIPGYVGRDFIAIEKFKVDQYIRVSEIYSSDLKFVIGCERTNSIHMTDQWISHYFDNQYFSGQVCAFEINEENKIGNFSD